VALASVEKQQTFWSTAGGERLRKNETEAGDQGMLETRFESMINRKEK
jgi:hypothetical protein